MSNKILILYDSIEYFIEHMEKKNVDVFRLYNKKDKLTTFIKKVFIKKKIFNKRWYGDWINNISNYDSIIIFAVKDYSFIKHIKENYPRIKLIFWYWNPAFRMGLPQKELYNLADIWSFDPEDCLKYNLKFNTTFYFNTIKLNNNDSDIDILFLGINKGRRSYLEKLENEILSSSELNTYFHIVPDKNEINIDNIKPISYESYLDLVSKSKCILDIMPIGQNGLTLRPMESIFLKKKLITNDTNIVNEDFYLKENIFVLGIDNFENLKTFIDSPYVELDSSIVNKYDFKNWLNRF